MKKILFVLFPFLAAHLFADGGGSQTILGQKNIRNSLVTWNAGTNTGKTRILFLGNNVYADTSTTLQAGEFKRIDNTADSCSNPFFITSDSLGGTRGIWEYRLWEAVRSVDKDSSTHVYRVQTREANGYINRNVQYTAWTLKGANSGYADVTVLDSILVPNAGTVSKISQYALFMVLGTQARLCPDDVAGSANAATDSIFADSIRVFVR